MTALRKPDGGVRGIVVGDIVRRLVARTIAKQVSKQAEKATAPFQYLSTKAGCECVAHILQAMTDPRQSSNRGLYRWCRGAYDLISRNAMLEGLCFYGSPSTFLWEDEMGETQEIPQGEGGEGDSLMPMLFALASIEHWRPFRVACVTARNCLLSSTTSIWLTGASCRCLEDR